MSPLSRLALASVVLALVALPLALRTPGVPAVLKADEPAYYLMALSLARDFDLRCELADLARLFEEFPYLEVPNLILMTDDGWRTVYFGKPYLYSLFAAPFAAVAGAGGMMALNALLFGLMLWQGTSYLRRSNPEGLALLFALLFFGLSAAAAYLVWLHPEVFSMAAISSCLYLGLTAAPAVWPRWLGAWITRWTPAVARALGSGAALALAVYHKPVYAALGLPVLALYARERRRREIVLWLAGAAACLALAASASVVLTGHPSAYLGVERQGVTVFNDGKMPVSPRALDPATPASNQNAWHWIFRLPETSLRRFALDLAYFWVGRHTGLLPYLPWTAIALLFFLLDRKRPREGWAILTALGAVALFFLLFIPFNWHGGGGFVGNRYFVCVYPAFLYLCRDLRPRWAIGFGAAASGLLLGPLLATLFGAPVVHPTLQAHVRHRPYDRLPLEQTLLLWNLVPGYRGAMIDDLWFFGRRDVFTSHDGVFYLGPGRNELWWRAEAPQSRALFEVQAAAWPSLVSLEIGGQTKHFAFGDAASQRVEFDLAGAARRVDDEGKRFYLYRLIVRASRARLADLRQPREPESDDRAFLAAVSLAYLGTPEALAADLYRVAWLAVDAPAFVAPGGRFAVAARLRNASDRRWPAGGGARVAVAYHWRRADGSLSIFEGGRTPLAGDLAPGQEGELRVAIEAPRESGTYRLELDLVREHVAWFGERRHENLYRIPIEVRAE